MGMIMYIRRKDIGFGTWFVRNKMCRELGIKL